MNKTQIIKSIVGKRLEPYGFKYLKSDGISRVFLREVTGVKRYYDPENDVVKQYIDIQESRYGQSLIVRYFTDAYGYEAVCSLDQLNKYSIDGWIQYTDENSYREKMGLLADLIVEYALDELDKMSVEDEIIPTKAMAEELFENHKQLAQEFIREFHLKTIPEKIEDLDEWKNFIKELMLSVMDQTYEEIKPLLLKVAAFIGDRSCELLGKGWIFYKHFKTPAVSRGVPYSKFSPLNEVVDLWKHKCCGECWKRFEWIIGQFKQGIFEKV